MKFVMIILVSLILASCASNEHRKPASEQTLEDGPTADSYMMNR